MLADQGWAKQAIGLTDRVTTRIKSDPLESWIEWDGHFGHFCGDSMIFRVRESLFGLRIIISPPEGATRFDDGEGVCER